MTTVETQTIQNITEAIISEGTPLTTGQLIVYGFIFLIVLLLAVSLLYVMLRDGHKSFVLPLWDSIVTLIWRIIDAITHKWNSMNITMPKWSSFGITFPTWKFLNLRRKFSEFLKSRINVQEKAPLASPV
ncbi:hypothetical protein ENBRE01_2559 [Enteropsectra breve]|nr:hypothetical protein ENBRE01_2495 [Enteropsectra breve]KAI5152086.1 hypothetical protein ENBRE01_2559 [Enteropsectra breve]